MSVSHWCRVQDDGQACLGRLEDDRIELGATGGRVFQISLVVGAVAMVLARAQGIMGEHRFLGGVNLSATQHCTLCTASVDNMVTNAKKLLNHGMELALKTWSRAMDVLAWTPDNIDHFIIHQVGKAHTESFAKALGIDLASIADVPIWLGLTTM